MKEGIVAGRMDEKRETARKMKGKDMPVNLIAELTGLTVDEIESI